MKLRAILYLRNALSAAVALSLVLAALPAAAAGHSGGGGRSSGGGGGRASSASSGGYRGASSGGYRGTYSGYGGGYRGAPSYSGGYRGSSGYSGGYRGASGYAGGYRSAAIGGYRGAAFYGARGSFNGFYAAHPLAYGGGWAYGGGLRWYNGYWHNYWIGANWLWWGGFYGFWLPLFGINAFVYEASPGVCNYWDGYEWVPYYDPDTGYYCPY